MVAYNFSERFAPLVESRSKCQTIRQTCRAIPGDSIQLYTGQRTKACRKLSEVDPICTSTRIVKIALLWADIDGEILEGVSLGEFAAADGFSSYDEMCKWFESHYGLPFIGCLTKWEWPDEN
jgi:hypothetical protein